MVMMTQTFVFVFTLLCTLKNVNSLCNVCQQNYAACLDEKRFSMCTAGKPEEKIYTCPDGYVCTTKTSICLLQSETNKATPSCDMTCGVCSSPGKLFSCLSNTTYAFCFGEDIPDLSAKGVCPDGYVCSLKSREVCKKATTVDVPSCNAVLEQKDSTTENSITTLKPKLTTSYSRTTVGNKDEPTISGKVSTVEVTSFKPTTAMVDIVTSPTQSKLSTTTSQRSDYESSFCREKQAEGTYRLKNDPTCQKFILCYFLAGQSLELQYTCSGSDFFNEQTNICQTDKPVDC